MLHFWQFNRVSIENTATFGFNTCLGCSRFWTPAERDAARPICELNSWDAQYIVDRYNEGNPVYYELPEWDPLGCSYFNAK